MTKDQVRSTEEALDKALEALEYMLEDAKQERLTVEYWNECVDAITAIKQARSAPVQEPPDDGFTQALIERDEYHAIADELAEMIAKITGEDIGEHTSANFPWRNALDAAENWLCHPSVAQPAPKPLTDDVLEAMWNLDSTSSEDNLEMVAALVQEPEHIVHSNGRYSPLLTRMMNKRVESNVKQVIHLYDDPPAQSAPVANTIIHAITEYGDARADQDANNAPITSHERLADCIRLVRKALAAQRQSAPDPKDRRSAWVGLTDWEIKRIGKLDLDNNYFGLWYDFARAIEAKLKAKNSP